MSAIRGRLTLAVQSSRERILEELADPKVIEEWIAAYRYQLRRKNDRAVRLLPELFKMIGPEQSINVIIQQRYGCQSEEELASMVEDVRGARQMTEEQRFERCLEYAQLYLKRNPERQGEALRRLNSVSLAEIMETEIAHASDDHSNAN